MFMRQLRDPLYVFNWGTLDGFFDDCADGKLPTYSFVEPRYYTIDDTYPANDQHPSHDVAEGEKFLKQLYEAVRNSPQWNSTALIILYDEHGGFYDHVPTPTYGDGVPNPDGKIATNGFNFTRLGVRIPAIIVSPWIEKGTVVHEPKGPYPTSQYDHSSIAATMKKVLGLPKFLNNRDAWAGTFEDIFLQRSTPRTDCPSTLPDPPVVMQPKKEQSKQPMNEFQLNMLKTAAHLFPNSGIDISEMKTEAEGGLAVQKLVNEFFARLK
eukprot:TRINITY_DN1205_c0_g1_i2.p1 TRINITY_DN1205_c0_g1~~TRINITY_DN1205_c0_g1_i2.p1  ORF type:complete len:267 (-),score=59.07 TRINITY_DN1205_c0_g1_i2:104-904(-)